MFDNLEADLNRYRRSYAKGFFSKDTLYLFMEQGVWALTVYRFGRWVRRIPIPIVSHILKAIAYLLFKLIEILTGISIPASAQIGKGFYIGHFGSIILHSDAKMGENCSIGPGVLIGTRGLGSIGVPVIGNNVYIGVGAKLLGQIKIGNNVKIGANAVVVFDVPDDSTVVGIPGQIKTKKKVI
jgi:serine O-acetyltransferase